MDDVCEALLTIARVSKTNPYETVRGHVSTKAQSRSAQREMREERDAAIESAVDYSTHAGFPAATKIHDDDTPNPDGGSAAMLDCSRMTR